MHRSRLPPPTPGWTSVVVISSRPSSPRNTKASCPRRANTLGHQRRHARHRRQPIADAAGCAGLVSGPRKLNAVGMPSSRRGTAVMPERRVEHRREAERDARSLAKTSRIVVGRDVEPDAELLEDVGRAAGARRGPVAVLDDAARPHPAVTTADIVEMLTVRGPVAAGADDVDDAILATSRRRGPWRASRRPGRAAPRRVSPLARSATANPAICESVRVAGEDLVHRPDGGGGVEVVTGHERRSGRRATCGGMAGPQPGWQHAAREVDDDLGEAKRVDAGAARRPRRATRWRARRPADGR